MKDKGYILRIKGAQGSAFNVSFRNFYRLNEPVRKTDKDLLASEN